MKVPLLALAGVCIAALMCHAAPALREVPFKIMSQQFEAGDSIVLQQILAASPSFKVGDNVVVRGRYRLASHSKAMLGFFLTTIGPSGATPISPKQRANILAGEGTFELELVVPSEGRLHVSFYGGPRGSSFGEVYFGPASR
jgi:hypothetical protein